MLQISLQEFAELLEGKTIAKVNTYGYGPWSCIEFITMTDGSVLNLSGNADCATIIDMLDSEGNQIVPEDRDDKWYLRPTRISLGHDANAEE